MSVTSVLGVFIIACVSFVLPPIVALSANALSPTDGSSEVINIGAGETIQRSFTATQGNLIVYGISNTSGGVLNYTIYDSRGSQVDSCTRGFHCTVYQHLATQESFNPPTTDTYVIAINFLAGSPSGLVKTSVYSVAGSLKLSLSGGIQNPVPTLSGATTTSFSSTDAAKVFQFTATQGNLIIYGISNTSDGVLDYSIYDSTGKQVDNCVTGFNCHVYQGLASKGTFNPPATGTYFIALILAGGGGSFNGVFAGNVKLSKTSSPKPVLKKKTITCHKGKLIKKVTAVKPVCPKGYKKK